MGIHLLFIIDIMTFCKLFALKVDTEKNSIKERL